MRAPSNTIDERVPGRAALAGNPSDGYRGAVLAVPVRAVSAHVTLRRADHFEIGGRAFASLDELRSVLQDRDLFGLTALGVAAVDAYATHIGRPAPCSIDIATTIPESVGLAGSSAVVIAALRGLARVSGVPVPPPDELAPIALAAEVDGLHIAAGPQDRVVQCHGRPMHMEFGGGEHVAVTPLTPIRLIVAYRASSAAPSGATHRPLRERSDRGDEAVRAAMDALAGQARLATTALQSGDLGSLGAAMDRSFDIRRSIIDLDATHVEMIEAARSTGAAANFSGSGGSITVLATDDRGTRRARAVLAELGCGVIDVPVS